VVTLPSYLAVARAVLNAQAPSEDVVVSPGFFNDPAHTDGWNNDTSPFTGADRIVGVDPSNTRRTCTSDFSFIGAINPSNHWIVTASHCTGAVDHGSSVYTCFTTDSSGHCTYLMGNVSKVYNNITSTNDDFETIGATGHSNIWDDTSGATDAWTVNGELTPVAGDLLSMEGITTGPTYRHTVTSAGPSTCFNETGDGLVNNVVCDAIIINTGGISTCNNGDSGGPIFQRESAAGLIIAAGILEAGATTSGTNYCYGQTISHIESAANLTLLEGSLPVCSSRHLRNVTGKMLPSGDTGLEHPLSGAPHQAPGD
jgi:hypothetical protein